jgi:hypothetical protein
MDPARASTASDSNVRSPNSNEGADLRARVEHLTRLHDEQRRAGKRQAAPFAKKAPKLYRKRSGRKPGKDYCTKAHRRPR